MTEKKLFGTDGIRGKAGQYPLDAPTVFRLGAALARALRSDDRGVRFLVGRDTRESGSWIERELAAGVGSQRGTLTSAGVIPTPAIAYLTSRMAYTAGVVISASHNPFDDNGIKVFSGTGEKFTETLERQVEAIVADRSWGMTDASSGGSSTVEQIDYRAEYLSHLSCILQPSEWNRSVRLVVDCANGATTTVAPQLFQSLGFDATCIGAEPDGRNINLHCGSSPLMGMGTAPFSSMLPAASSTAMR